MVLAHYSERFDVEEVTAGFPSEIGEFDMAEVLRLMELVRPYADHVLSTADLELHITSQTDPESAEKQQSEEKPRDFPAERLFHAAANKALTSYHIVRYVLKFTYGDSGMEAVIDPEVGASK
jgi:hypothetical protein